MYFGVMDLLTGDGGLAVFTAVGIVATAFSIVRDAKAQKARLVTEDVQLDDVQLDYPRAA